MLQFLPKTIRSLFIGIALAMAFYAQSFSQATQLDIVILSEEDSYYTGVPIYIKVNAVDNAGTTDLNFTGNITAEAVGSDTLVGTTTVTCNKGKASFTNLFLNTAGIYQIRFTSSGLTNSESATITVIDNPYTKGGSSTSALACWDELYDTVETGDYFVKCFFALNANGEIDTTFNSYFTIQQISGTSIMNAGNSKAYSTDGVCIASQYMINTAGTYQFVCSYSSLVPDTFSIVAIEAPLDSTNCIIPDTISGKNLGLYGATAQDFAFSQISNRLFTAVPTPQSLFFSDDTAQSWQPSFSADSLEFECGTRGWGGRAMRVLTNSKGWVAVYTNSRDGGALSACVVSFNDGDTGTWQTAIDPTILSDWGYGNGDLKVKEIALTDYHVFSLSGIYIIMQNSDLSFPENVIELRKKLATTISSDPRALSIAAPNSSSGFPFYVVIDTSGSYIPTSGTLFKYDGANLTSVSLPSGITAIGSVFTPPAQITADTLFISGKDVNDSAFSYRSFDGGTNWTLLTIGQNVNNDLTITDIDYSPFWANLLPSSNGNIILGNGLISLDLGITWDTTFNVISLKALLPSNMDYNIRTAGGQIYTGSSGLGGTASRSPSSGLEAVVINQIAKTTDKSVFYIATNSGLAYTTAYNDTNVSYENKWRSPYGQYPVSSIDSTVTSSAVAIDPNNPLHVVEGHMGAFFVSNTGPDGFLNVIPSGYINEATLSDLRFVNSDIILATKGNALSGNDNDGSVWRSSDGGFNWNSVLPDTFGSANILSVACGLSDTVIYMGSGSFADNSGQLWKSTNLGETWTKGLSGPVCTIDSTLSAMAITAIAAVPNQSGNLYIGASYFDCNAFMYSADGGSTASYIQLPNDTHAITAIAINRNYNDSIYVAVGREVFVYNAFKDTVTLAYRGLPAEQINDLASGSILVGTTTGFYGLKLDNTGTVTNVNEVKKNKENSMIQIYPNPSLNEFYVDVQLFSETNLSISMVDFMGREISAIANVEHAMGKLHYKIDSSKLSSGTYFVRAKTDAEIITKKVVVIR